VHHSTILIYINNMNHLYKIANFVIAINKPSDISLPDGFEIFKLNQIETIESRNQSIATFNLNKQEPATIISKHHYKVSNENREYTIGKDVNGYKLEIKEDGILRLTMSCEGDQFNIYGDLQQHLIRYAIWLAFNLSIVNKGAIAMHASSVLYKNKAIICLGESGTGKSTHTWNICNRFEDAELLNDDSPIIRIEDGKCIIYGSPWSGKTACYINKSVELAAAIRLSQAKENRIKELNLQNSIAAIIPSLPPEIYLDSSFHNSIFSIISTIIEQARILSLECLPNHEAAELTINSVIIDDETR